MHLSTNFGKEIREKKSPGTNGLTIEAKFARLDHVNSSLIKLGVLKHPDDFRTSFTELNQNKQTLIICISYENDKRVQWLRFYLPKQNNKIQLITYFLNMI